LGEKSFIVRYAETDQMGIVHHSNYPVWFEAGRTEFFSKLGINYSNIENSGYLLPLTHMTVEFKNAAKYEDEIIIKTKLVSLTCVRTEFAYEVFNSITGVLYAIGSTNHAWTNKELKPVNIETKAPEVYALLKKSKNKNLRF
jgi:acyl-CoA thioester hydrolase